MFLQGQIDTLQSLVMCRLEHVGKWQQPEQELHLTEVMFRGSAVWHTGQIGEWSWINASKRG